jgi:hypothetical protein
MNADSQGESLTPTVLTSATPLPTRPAFDPGELVEYTAQSGDTLPALAAHFNTGIDQILAANPIIPSDVTTLPSGLPMRIPIYYRPFWGSPYKIIPDSQFIFGPSTIHFDAYNYISDHPGWLKDYTEYAAGAHRNAAGIIDYVAQNFSVSPRIMLALLEFKSGALSHTILSEEITQYPLGYRSKDHEGLYLQLVWAANTLNNGYYGWRTGKLVEFEHPVGRIEQPDPWQNSASVALQYYFNLTMSIEDYSIAVGPDGFSKVYTELFGDTWLNEEEHMPGNLELPHFRFPFEQGKRWAFTGGPHTGWGQGDPWAALDFAPPSTLGGCQPSDEWATAIAPGFVVRSEPGIVSLDLDEDGDERTGWVILYLHIGTDARAPVGASLALGDPVGHPSCEGGSSTGTHIHIARKFNGEWMPAAGPLPFVMEGWTPGDGDQAYAGTLTRYNQTVVACVCANFESMVVSTEPLESPME